MNYGDDIDFEDIFEACKIISGRLGGCFTSCHFLDYLLETPESNHPYSNNPNYWPSPVEVVDRWELPADLRQRFASSVEGISLCGIFPEISRAWASVDTSLFLWGFDKWCRYGKCLEYNVGEQVICAVGLANPKPCVFGEAIQHLLVLATPTQLILVGICCSRKGSGRDPYEEVSLQQLPDYTLPLDGVIVTCVTCTDNGRIFLAGRDGHIYELKYSVRSVGQKCCHKICLTSRWLVDILGFKAVDPVTEIVFDNERKILYAITEKMRLQVFKLGENEDTLRKVAEETNVNLVSISPVCQMESMSIHLLAVMSDGRRVFYNIGNKEYKPSCLNVISIRHSPMVNVIPPIGRSYHSCGTLILSSSVLTIVSKDYSTQPSASGNIGELHYTRHALWESVTSLPLEGRVLCVADILPLINSQMTLTELCYFGDPLPSREKTSAKSLEKASSRLWSRRDLSLQHMLFRRRVVVFTTMGMMELVFNRPVDILRILLEANPSHEAIEYFFNRYGTAEAASMCLMLAANIADNENLVSSIVVDRATDIYENPTFVGMPQIAFQVAEDEAEHETVFSGAYEGFCFCAARLLDPVWYFSFMDCKISGSSKKPRKYAIACRIPVTAMQALEIKLRSLEGFFRLRKIKRRGIYSNDLAAAEVRVIECLRQLLLRSSEALFLLQLLSNHNMDLVVENLDDMLERSLPNMSFDELVYTKEGQRLATRLIAALMEYCTGRDGRPSVDDITGELCKGCPSYFMEKNYKFNLAMEYLGRATASSNIKERENLAREAFNFLNPFPASADLRIICRKFEQLRFYEAVVRFPLQKAQALDPGGNAVNEQIDQAILAQRENYYEIIAIALRNLREEGFQRDFDSPTIYQPARSFLDQSSRNKYICQIVQLAVQSPDKLLHEYIYRTMIDIGLENELLECAGQDLELFLQRAEARNEVNNASKYLHLLARFYVIKRQHLLAANVLLRLANRRSIDGRDVPSLEERYQCLCNAILQAKNVINNQDLKSTDGLLHLLEGKLDVLRFQLKIKKELESIIGISETGRHGGIPEMCEADLANSREKVEELSLELKSISQLFNDYAVPFELWEVCLEMMYFANTIGDADSNFVKEVWVRLIEQSLLRGSITEACSIMKRVGSHLYPGNGVIMLPLDTLCLHLEKAALEGCASSDDSVRDEEIPRALLSACKEDAEPVFNTYNHLLSNAAIPTYPGLRQRLLRSVLVILKEWEQMLISGKLLPQKPASVIQGVIDKITTAENRYAAEVRRLRPEQSRAETVYQGFSELKKNR